MVARFYYSDPTLGTVELTDRIDRTAWQLQERAEEGTFGQASIVIEDRDMDLDLAGFRPFWVIEDDSESTDNVIFGGYVNGQTVSRGSSDDLQPLGRVWECEVTDSNAVWSRRVMMGADCKRPEEGDDNRVAWLLSTAESGIFDDVTTYVWSGAGVSMDKVDYRRQMRDQVMSDASQASNRNWWAQRQETGTGRELFVWYGMDTLALYDSGLFLSNDPTDWADDQLADGTSLVWPLSGDTKLGRDFGRVYSGVVVEYAKGAVYRHSAATTAAYCRRDMVARYPNVKTKTKAIARAVRLLAKMDEPTLIVTTTVELPAAKATMIRAGMRIPARGTHFTDGLDTWHWYRVVTCAIAPAAGGNRYRLTLELEPTGQTADAPPTPGVLISGIMGNAEVWRNSEDSEAYFMVDGVMVIDSAAAAAANGLLTMFDPPIRAHTVTLRHIYHWTNSFMPGTHYNTVVILDETGTVDLAGNGWTPGYTDMSGLGAHSTQLFDAVTPLIGPLIDGYVAGVLQAGTTGATRYDQTGDWRIAQHPEGGAPIQDHIIDYTWTVSA